MTLQDLFENVSLIFNDYITIAEDTATLGNCEMYTFYTGCGSSYTEEELLLEVSNTCKHFLSRNVVAITSVMMNDSDAKLEIVVSL